MKKLKSLALSLLVFVGAVSCSENSSDIDTPMGEIVFTDAKSEYYVLYNEKITITPQFETSEDVTVAWYIGGKKVYTGASFDYMCQRTGSVVIKALATTKSNKSGVHDYTVYANHQMEFDSSEATTMTIPPEKRIELHPLVLNRPSNAVFEWTDLATNTVISSDDNYAFTPMEEGDVDLQLIVRAEGMADIMQLYNITVGISYAHPNLLWQFQAGTKFAATEKKNDAGYRTLTADFGDGYLYRYIKYNNTWGNAVSTYMSGRSWNSAGNVSSQCYKIVGQSVANLQQTAMVAIYCPDMIPNTQDYFSSAIQAPEVINDGELRYFAISLASAVADFGRNLHPDGSSGKATMFQTKQERSSANSGDNQPIVEFGYNADGKFGAIVRGGTKGLSGDITSEFVEVDVEPFHEGGKWTDYVIEYKFSPFTKDGYIKIHAKRYDETTYTVAEKSGVQIGYSSAPSFLESTEFGFDGTSKSSGTIFAVNAIAYSDNDLVANDERFILK